MDEQELIERRDEIQTRLKESGLADKCVQVAIKLGKDRDSRQGETYTNLNYLYDEAGLKIDCNIGQNMQGDGRLFVEQSGRIVFNISNSYPHNNREDLPVAIAQYVRHRVLVYQPGEWERKIDDLAPST